VIIPTTFVRYILVGGLAAMLDYGMFLVVNYVLTAQTSGLLWLMYPEQWANSAGMMSGFLLAFILNRNWSFRSTGSQKRQFILSVLLLLTNNIVCGALIVLLCRDLHMMPSLAKPLLQALVVIWNYLIFKYLIYGKPHEQ